ncbi:MAG TPA: 5'-nucleotidase, lipoprotein e(P4) family [Pyrinomonadaceae bacterium]|nr:5'-nucleotidase, lipoprotein e(P4) family [Pyrinomonadaceae bacterium]
MKKVCLCIAVMVSVNGVAPVGYMGQEAARQPETQAKEGANNEYMVGSVLWTQSSGEARALAYQAFNFARILLDRDFRLNRKKRTRRAVVVDIDETVLDNSRYQAWIINERKSYPEGWTAWINRAQAAAVPGAVEFLNYARARGVRVFYVTNRKPEEKEGTRANLLKLGFPDVTDQTLLVKTDPNGSSKEPRRQEIAKRFRVVLLIGDDLNDFAEIFEQKKTVNDRIAASDQSRELFGTRFIVLPNAMYGDWENAVYDYDFKMTDAQKNARRRSLLKSIEAVDR